MVTWIAALACALGLLTRYKLIAGAAASTEATWPEDTHLVAKPGIPTVLLFAHPRCPCTRASLTEFRELMSDFEGRVSATVVFMRPDGTPIAWEKSDTWKQANEIRGVTVLTDEGARETQRFGVKTSGHVVAYGPSGELIFAGGITASRGHVGENAQLAELRERLERVVTVHERRTASVMTSGPVYGCPMNEGPAR